MNKKLLTYLLNITPTSKRKVLKKLLLTYPEDCTDTVLTGLIEVAKATQKDRSINQEDTRS